MVESKREWEVGESAGDRRWERVEESVMWKWMQSDWTNYDGQGKTLESERE